MTQYTHRLVRNDIIRHPNTVGSVRGRDACRIKATEPGAAGLQFRRKCGRWRQPPPGPISRIQGNLACFRRTREDETRIGKP